jgi:hypothetical protein
MYSFEGQYLQQRHLHSTTHSPYLPPLSSAHTHIALSQTPPLAPTRCALHPPPILLVCSTTSQLNLVDLAGSERVLRSGATGVALQVRRDAPPYPCVWGSSLGGRFCRPAHVVGNELDANRKYTVATTPAPHARAHLL